MQANIRSVLFTFVSSLALACSGSAGSTDASAPAEAGALDMAGDGPADAARPMDAGSDLVDGPTGAADASDGGASADAADDVPGTDMAVDQVPGDLAGGSTDTAPADATATAPDGGGACGDTACVGSNWARWPMPNTAADVANGAPHPAMLVDNGDDTVSDGVTGLMWQRTASATRYTRADAQARCQRLRVGNHDDWRVPSLIELASLIDYDHADSSIDPKAFPDSPIDPNGGEPVAYFGSTTLAGPADWMVDFAIGQLSLDRFETDRPTYLRCVRGPRAPASDTSAGRYDLSMTGIAVDRKTGLAWQRTAPGGSRKLADAKAYCATKTGLPGTGWRLPTIKELMTLVDATKAGKFRIDESVFNTPTEISDPYSVFWSATAVVQKPPYAQFTTGMWALYFDSGQTNYVDSTGYGEVRCVR